MTAPIRIPLVEAIEPRLADSNKDGLASNVFYDKNSAGQIFATKRPGIDSFITGSGQASGIFGNAIFQLPIMNWYEALWNGENFCVITNKTSMNTGHPSMSIISEDGISWRQGFLPLETYWEGLAWDGAVFCAVSQGDSGGTRYVATSPDGLNWTSRTSPNLAWSDLTSNGNGLLVGVGIADTGVTSYSAYSSDNGVTWNTGNLSSAATAIAWNSGQSLFCAVKNGGTVVSTSSNGATWTNRTIASASFQTICSNGTIFFAPAYATPSTPFNSNKGYYSTNGVSWTEVTLPSSRIWTDSCWTGTHFVIVSYSDGIGSTDSLIAYSTDAISWTQVILPELTGQSAGNSFYQIVAGNTDIVIALGLATAGNEYAFSQDGGVTFTSENLGRTWPWGVIV